MKKLLLFWCLLAAVSISADVFKVDIAPQMQIKYRSQLLVDHDTLYLNDKELPVFTQKDVFTAPDGRKVYNQFGSADGVRFRREVSVAPDGSSVELAMQFAVESRPVGTPLRRTAYRIYLPLKSLQGAQWTARVGRARNVTTKSGQITPQTKGEFVGEKIRQIAFKCPDGREFVIDCNPKGVNGQGDFASGLTGRWNALILDDMLVLNTHIPAEFFGGTAAGHIVIYEGSDKDYFRRHAHNRYFYYSNLNPEKMLALGADKTGKQYEKVSTRLWSAKNRAGWLDDQGLSVQKLAPEGALYSYTAGKGKKIFKLSSLRKGLHLLTLNISTGTAPAGPFDIKCNQKFIVRNGRVSANSVGQYLIPVWLEDGTAELEFSGQWQISTIGDQLLQTSDEDFTFRRGLWRRTGIFEPSIMLSSKAFAAEPAYKISYSEFPLPPAQITAPAEAKTFPAMQFTRPDFTGQTDWRGGNIVGTMGPGNSGTLTEFNTAAKIRQRLDELSASRTRVVVINGLLSRHTYSWHRPRIREYVKAITDQGHKRGMKFIDHQDFSLLWDCEAGFRTLVENTDALQRAVNTGLPIRGFCLNNERYVSDFIRYMTEYVRYTNIDGLMLDETTFHGMSYCACADCRKLFTQLTGLQLPLNELNKNLYQPKSALWRSWLNFRRHCRERFWNRLKIALQKVRKDIVIMGYNTHGNLMRSKHEYAMGDPNNYVDFYGTEVMPRNVLATAFGTAGFRKAMTMYPNSQGIPVYTMTYATGNNFDLQYFGWALANLHGQTYWDYIARGQGKFDYCAFDESQGNMDLKQAQSVSKIALLFSYPSLLWGRGISSTNEIIGWSQILSKKHYQHDFISAEALHPDGLKKYEVLIVGNATVLTAEQIKNILGFVRRGGRVYFSYMAAVGNAGGELYKDWPLGKIFGLQLYIRNTMKPVGIARGKEILFKYEIFIPAIRVEALKNAAPAQKLWNFEVAPKYGRRPALYCVNYGQGKLYYSPMAFGAAVMQGEISVGKVSKYQRTPRREAAAMMIMSDIIEPRHRVWEAAQIPETVLSSIYQDESVIYVHLLNCAGGETAFGQKVPPLPGKAAWSEPGEIKFILPDKNIRSAVAHSPEFVGKSKPLSCQPVQNGTLITVPKQTFKVYTVIKIQR